MAVFGTVILLHFILLFLHRCFKINAVCHCSCDIKIKDNMRFSELWLPESVHVQISVDFVACSCQRLQLRLANQFVVKMSTLFKLALSKNHAVQVFCSVTIRLILCLDAVIKAHPLTYSVCFGVFLKYLHLTSSQVRIKVGDCTWV